MFLQSKCFVVRVIGLLVSIVAAVLAGVLITTTAYRWLKYFMIAIWILTALSLLGSLIASMINVYHENRRLSKMLKDNFVLLIIGAVSAIIATAVLTLLVRAGTVTLFTLKFLTAISAFAAGLVMTADVSLIYGLINGCRRILPAPCEDEKRK